MVAAPHRSGKPFFGLVLTRRALMGLAFFAIVVPLVVGLVVMSRVSTTVEEPALAAQAVTAVALAAQLEERLEGTKDLVRLSARRRHIESPEAAREALAILYSIQPHFRSLAFYDPDQELLAAFPREPATRPRHLLAGGRVRIDEDDTIVVLSSPVGDEGALLLAELSLARHVPQITGFRYRETGRANLVDEEGRVLLSGRPERRGHQLEHIDLAALAEPGEAVHFEFFSPLLDREMMATLHPLELRPWVVIVDGDRAEVMAPAVELGRWMLVGLLGLVVGGGGITVALSRSLAQQERQLENERRRAEEMERHSAYLARTDALTELMNRREFERILHREVHRALEEGQELTLLMLDLDGFKLLNDRWGHPAGDRALRVVAEVFRKSVRTGDHVARMGGDEFAVIQPGCPRTEAEQVADRIRRAIGEIALPLDRMDRHLGISVGIASLRPEDRLDDLVLRADHALYDAKYRKVDRYPR